MLAQKYFRQLLDGVVCKPKYSICEKYITNHVTVHDSAEIAWKCSDHDLVQYKLTKIYMYIENT